MLAIPANALSQNSSEATQMRQALSKGFCSIVVSLTTTTYGLTLFKNDMYAVMNMVSTLDPHGRSECVDMVEEVVGLVRDVLRACEAVDIVLSSSTTNSVIDAGAICTLNEVCRLSGNPSVGSWQSCEQCQQKIFTTITDSHAIQSLYELIRVVLVRMAVKLRVP